MGTCDDNPVKNAKLNAKGRLKCNRQSPCSSCEIRGDSNKCTYAPKKATHGAHPNGVSKKSSSSQTTHERDLQQRLDKLESLIVKAASNQQPHQPSETVTWLTNNHPSHHENGDSNTPQRSSSTVGTLKKVDSQLSVYVGETAFDGILQEVDSLLLQYCRLFYSLAVTQLEDLRGTISSSVSQNLSEETQREDFELRQSPAPTIGLIGATQSLAVSRTELLKALPSKATSDALILKFFSVNDPAIPGNCEHVLLPKKRAY